MDYMQEEPYPSHRFVTHEPYFSAGAGSGGGYDADYANNTSFDRHSDHSIQSDRHRPMAGYSDMPNGGHPYGGNSSSNIYPTSSQQQMRASPQPARSLSPPDYSPPGVIGGGGDRSHYERESAYHNLPPYQEAGGGGQYYDDRDELVAGDPHSDDFLPPEAADHPYTDGDTHAGYGHRESPYAGSHTSFQGPQKSDAHHSGNYTESYVNPRFHDNLPRYNGGVHYPEDTYNQGPHDDYMEYPDDAARPFNEHPQYSHQEGYPVGHHPDEYPDIENRDQWQEDTYNDSFQQNAPHQQQPNSSFRDLRHDSYHGPPSPDRYIDAPRERHSFDQPGNASYSRDSYQNRPPSRINDSFQRDPNVGDDYVVDVQRHYDGLPPVRADPFADDPFREQHSWDSEQIRLREDPYYRGPSPPGGVEPVPYDDRDLGDSYSPDPRRYLYDADYPAGDRSIPYAPDDSYLPEDEAAHKLQQLTLGAPASDGRRTPSVDSRGYSSHLRFPDLQEVIDFLSSPDDSVKASAAAHLQHITYMDDAIKAKTRSLGGIPPLIRLLTHDLVDVHKNACGALQNLSYGKNNNENKRAIKNENGIPELIRLLRKTDQEDVKESVTGVLWNLSSCEDLKLSVIEDGLTVLVNNVILKYSGWSALGSSSSQLPWTTVCRNTTGILRNVSSAGFDARKRLRECKGLVNALIYILKLAAEDTTSNDIDNKVVENTVCVLRNLSYRIQEVVDPDFYKKRSLPRQHGQVSKGKTTKTSESSAGCFGNKSSKAKTMQTSKSGSQPSSAPLQLPPTSTEYRSLWGGEIHMLYSTVLRRCTNPITMEAAAGAIQNLTACDWQPAVDSRAMVRKEKGLPLLVDLLSAESDRVVCATATALRNLAIDDKNKELVGKYAIRQLVSRLPRDDRNNLPDDTICAVVATLYEVVKDNQDFALALVQEEGIPRLLHINRSQGRYLARTLKFTLTLLKTLWGYKSLHAEYAKLNCGQADFTTSKATPRQDSSRSGDISQTPVSSNHTTPYNTLSRPMSGQGYDDNTLTPARANQVNNYIDNRDYHRNAVDDADRHRSYQKPRQVVNDIPLNELNSGYAALDEPQPHRTKPPVGGVPLFPNLSPVDPVSHVYSGDPMAGSEPLYAQVNKGSKRRNDASSDSVMVAGGQPGMHLSRDGAGGNGADSWV
ncbi:hypothetical protein BsWGS_07842 [Bradybaena similaris]